MPTFPKHPFPPARKRKAVRRGSRFGFLNTLLAAAIFFTTDRPAAAQHTWNGTTDGSWNTATNWTGGLPASNSGTAITLAGTTNTITVQNIAATFQLNSLTMGGSAADGFTINAAGGNLLQFAGTTPTINYSGTSGSASALIFNTAVDLGSTSSTITINSTAGTGTYFEVLCNGPVGGSGGSTISLAGGALGGEVVFAGGNGTFSGTAAAGGAGKSFVLAGSNVFGQGVTIDSGSSLTGGIRVGVPANNNGLTAAGSTQQFGSLKGASGSVTIGDAANSSAVLFGFNDTSDNFGGFFSMNNAASVVAKVGTGIFTATASSTTFSGGLSVRDGTFVLSGSGNLGSTSASQTATTPVQSISVYTGSELRTVTGTSTGGRIQNNSAVTLNGGLLRMDASGLAASGTGYSEVAGNLTLGSGQSTLRLDTPAGRGARFSFNALSSSGVGGTLFVQSNNLGANFNTANTGAVNFTAAPTAQLVGGTTTYGTTATNLSILPYAFAAASSGGSPATFVTYDESTATLRALADTNYNLSFASPAAADNVNLAAAGTLAAPTVINSLRLNGGTLDLNGNDLTLASGGLLDATAVPTAVGISSSSGGALRFGASGGSTAFVTTNLDLLLSTPMSALNFVKSGGGQVQVNAALTLTGTGLPAAPRLIVVNAGVLRFGSASSVAATGSLVYQVSKGASLDFVNGLTVGMNQTVRGAGSVGGGSVLTVASGGMVEASVLGGPSSSLASPGTLTVSNLTMQGGGTYVWNLSSVRPSGYTQSLIAVTGVLDISGLDTASNKFTVKLQSLTPSNAAGSVYDFESDQGYSWPIATFGSLNGAFGSNKFTVDTSGLTNSFDGTFAVVQQGNTLAVSYVPVPEPSAILLMSGLGLGAGFVVRRVRRRTEMPLRCRVQE